MKNNKKGFTLAELLIVVAIIAVLVAISIPIFTTQLEKAREATDLANLRSAYAEVSADALTAKAGETIKSIEVEAHQKGAWEHSDGKVAGIAVDASEKGWTVAWDDTNSKVTFTAKTGS